MSTTTRPQRRGLVQVLPLAMKHWRVDHLGWSQRTAASRASRSAYARANGVKVSESAIAMIEAGLRQPSWDVSHAIADAYSIPVGAFAVVVDEPEEAAS